MKESKVRVEEQLDFSDLNKLFNTVINYMNEQFLEIREARKLLFSRNIQTHGAVTSMSASDSTIKWYFCEIGISKDQWWLEGSLLIFELRYLGQGRVWIFRIESA
ncbi:hypothetical protein B7494_g3049 [Chlorociboria aeruginascens]|nr:hypothetical protein B7494_g3049 [Chlorociboria aeruginascens]